MQTRSLETLTVPKPTNIHELLEAAEILHCDGKLDHESTRLSNAVLRVLLVDFGREKLAAIRPYPQRDVARFARVAQPKVSQFENGDLAKVPGPTILRILRFYAAHVSIQESQVIPILDVSDI
jgi:hypothetical protein